MNGRHDATAALLAGLLGGGGRDERARVSDDIEAGVLKGLMHEVMRPCPFRVGDVIRQRKGRSAYTFEDKLCIVTHIHDAPNLDRDTESSYLRDDIIILVRSANRVGADSVQEHTVQSWRFDLYTGPVIE